MTTMQSLEELVTQLDQLLANRTGNQLATDQQQPPAGKDAIDTTLATAPRGSAVTSLHNHEAVIRLRQELTSDLLRAKTVQKLLDFVLNVLKNL